MVVYVHGLWLTGIEGGILRRRLAKTLSAETRVFSYASVRSGIAANAQALAKFLGGLRADTLHLVGHSLGGLVILKLFESPEGARLPPGRIVVLGSPLNGSLAARNLARLPFGKKILGQGIDEALLRPQERPGVPRPTAPPPLISQCLPFRFSRCARHDDGHRCPSPGTKRLLRYSSHGRRSARDRGR